MGFKDFKGVFLVAWMPVLLVSADHLSFNLTGDGFSASSFSGDASYQRQPCECVHLTTRDWNKQPVNSSGRMIYNDPFRFRDDSPRGVASFNTSFTFKIEQVLEQNQSALFRPGAGFGFMLVPEQYKKVPDNSFGEYMGLLNSSMEKNNDSHLLAVEFDNVLNLELGDQSANHIGVDVNSLQSLSVSNLTAGLELSKNYTLSAWIEYDADKDLITVRMSNGSSRPEDYLLRTSFTLKGVRLSDVLTEYMYVGFSAATGADCFQFHSISAWNFSISTTIRRCEGWSCRKVWISVVAAAASALILLILLLFAFLWFRSRKFVETLPEFSSTITRFSYKELRSAAKGFSRKRLLGSGGFAKVYKGTLRDGTLVAIKYLDRLKTSSSTLPDTSLEQFIAEISVIGRLRHRNLVGLKGICYERGELLLVYEYMANKSLDKFLFKDGAEEATLSWKQRFNILKGIAEALAFLHEGWEQRVLHRDVKVANVLLDAKFNAKLGDFGLSKFIEHGTGSVTLTAVGTPGYMAPELFASSKATEKTDVFSFGILVLEVVSGRRRTKNRRSNGDDSDLLEFVGTLFAEKRELEAVDGKLLLLFDKDEVRRAISLGLVCCNPDPSKRPTMRNCCQMLEESNTTPVWEVPAMTPPQSLSFSEKNDNSSSIVKETL